MLEGLRLPIFAEDNALGQWGFRGAVLRFFGRACCCMLEGVLLAPKLSVNLLWWYLGHVGLSDCALVAVMGGSCREGTWKFLR